MGGDIFFFDFFAGRLPEIALAQFLAIVRQKKIQMKRGNIVDYQCLRCDSWLRGNANSKGTPYQSVINKHWNTPTCKSLYEKKNAKASSLTLFGKKPVVETIMELTRLDEESGSVYSHEISGDVGVDYEEDHEDDDDDTRLPVIKQLIGLHEAMVPDILHNFLKGSLQDSIAWTQSIFECVVKLDINYSYSLSRLDKRLQNFPRRQALNVFPVIWLSGGISEHFKHTTSKKSASQSSGFGGGNVPAWKYPSMAMQILLSLGNDLLPSTRDWWIHFFGYMTKINPVPVFNVAEVVTNSLVLNLEIWWWLTSDIISESNLVLLSQLVLKVRVNMLNLHIMKFHLTKKAFTHAKDYKAQWAPPNRGIKHHMLEHLDQCIRNFGSNNSGIDTQISEKSHKQSKEAFLRTNKHYDTASRDMLRSIVTRNAVKDFCLFRKDATDGEELESDEEDAYVEDEDSDDGIFHWVPTMLCTRLLFSTTRKKFVMLSNPQVEVSDVDGLIPIISLSQLHDVLKRKCFERGFIQQCESEGDDVLNLIKRGLGLTTEFPGDTDAKKVQVQVVFMNQMSCDGIPDKKIKPFQLYATKKFNRRIGNATSSSNCRDNSVFSFVELNYEGLDDGVLARVASLMSFEDTSGKLSPYMVGIFLPLEKTSTCKFGNRFLQPPNFERCTYSKYRGQFQLDLLPFGVIKSPAFAVPEPLKNKGFTDCKNSDVTFIWIPSTRMCHFDGIQLIDVNYEDIRKEINESLSYFDKNACDEDGGDDEQGHEVHVGDVGESETIGGELKVSSGDQYMYGASDDEEEVQVVRKRTVDQQISTVNIARTEKSTKRPRNNVITAKLTKKK